MFFVIVDELWGLMYEMSVLELAMAVRTLIQLFQQVVGLVAKKLVALGVGTAVFAAEVFVETIHTQDDVVLQSASALDEEI